jgi:DNA-binding XRE family transcriptional regulator
MAPKDRPLEDRFWEKVDKTNGCWIWNGGQFQNGYGKFTIKGRQYRAHRVSYELAHGPIPADALLRHTCGNRLCVRPEHLKWGGVRESHAAQMTNMNRSRVAKLTEQDVRQIRQRYADHEITQRQLAKEYGISVATVQSVLDRRSWRHVDAADHW